MAHPDDAELWVGGTLALHAREAAACILVSSTEERRKREARAGARVLGCEIVVGDELSRELIIDVTRSFQPNAIVTHHFDDTHPEHRRTTELVMEALPALVIQHNFPSRLYFCDSYNSMLRSMLFPGSVVVDVTETFEQKIKALRKHRSQPMVRFEPMARRMAAMWGGRARVAWGEAFVPCPILGNIPRVGLL
ncbi:MAG TPA: PIG-L family deacetylase [Thermoanaerobaculia bacterium]|jgi:LmbE family N-acetylglucosaminyl deacetylase